ncbi:hypothetical protein FE633_24220 [Streptomyces montanus]|uniref:NifU family protein n=1 Tax=Streptomyces montanus TaxID=2580423 RepID=A0A5R9FIN1_9ACTN|nr:hypothetical protein [Streptomyces montanus]TLS43692.1 hypothetical protein FE633_24220 [Streptomyces montanus]
MSAPNAEQAGLRVEEVLDRLAATGDTEVCAAAEELVRVLMEFYGAGLARVLELLRGPADQPSGPALSALLDDELVASLLVLHGLHPDDAPTRIARALRSVPHPVEHTGFDPATGVLRLRATSSAGCGCPSTRESVRQAAVDALACLAPEVTGVEMETEVSSREPALLQIGSGPPRVEAGRRAADAVR